MVRLLILGFVVALCCLIGCSEPATDVVLPKPTTPAKQDTNLSSEFESKSSAQPAVRVSDVPANLGIRKRGVDWPQFLGPTGDSKSSETGILAVWPKSGPRVIWETKLGVSYGMPVISRGRLFQFDRFRDQARLTCMESETGKELWRFEYPTAYEDMLGYNNGPRCSPVVDGDRVYIYGVEGILHCVSVHDGKPIWNVDTVTKFGVVQNFFGVGSSPVIEGDLLIAQVGGSPAAQQNLPPGRMDLARGDGSAVVAFDKRTGDVKYKISDELASYAGPTLASVDGRRWCFVFARGGLLAFNPTDGAIDFHYPWRAKLLESVNASNPIVVGNQVFISETYGPGSSLLKVRPGGYDVVWKDSENPRDEKSMQTHWNTPIHVDGHIYGSSGRHHTNAELRCVELATGKVKWSELGLTRCSLLYVDGHFVCQAEYGQLLLIKVNPEKYEEVARVKLQDAKTKRELIEYPAWAAPILSHGLLYLRGKDRLVCVELIP